MLQETQMEYQKLHEFERCVKVKKLREGDIKNKNKNNMVLVVLFETEATIWLMM